MKVVNSILFILLIGPGAFAESFSEYSERVRSERELSRNEGLSYMVSGSLVLLGGTFGWADAEKPVEKGFYSLAQTLGILAIGFGAEAYFVKTDEQIFLQVLNSADLTMEQKNKMFRNYMIEKKMQQDDINQIRRVTFGLAGLLNLVYATQVKDPVLKNILYVTAGVELVWAFTF